MNAGDLDSISGLRIKIPRDLEQLSQWEATTEPMSCGACLTQIESLWAAVEDATWDHKDLTRHNEGPTQPSK